MHCNSFYIKKHFPLHKFKIHKFKTVDISATMFLNKLPVFGRLTD